MHFSLSCSGISNWLGGSCNNLKFYYWTSIFGSFHIPVELRGVLKTPFHFIIHNHFPEAIYEFRFYLWIGVSY